jgi:DNA helicase-2/ATP-dependent DNA helicase PcrA
MLDFVGTYPDTKFIVLKNNYRSAQSILDLSIDLIENNTQRLVNKLPDLKKELIAQRDYKDLDNNKYFILEDEILEKLFVLEDIKKKIGQTQRSAPTKNNVGVNLCVHPETFAIICRSNKEVESWTKFMQLQNIEVESKLKTNILKNKFVGFILDFLRVIENPDFSDEKLLDILRTDIVDIENIDVISLSKELYKKNYSRS